MSGFACHFPIVGFLPGSLGFHDVAATCCFVQGSAPPNRFTQSPLIIIPRPKTCNTFHCNLAEPKHSSNNSVVFAGLSGS